MIRLYLVRHGETEFNLQGRIQGHGDSPLTPLGRKQAEAVASRLSNEHFDAVYSSDLGRAVETAQIIAPPHSLPVHPTPLLRERNFGVVQGMTRAQIEERFPSDQHEWRRNPSGTAPPGAETHAQVVGRCGKLIDEIIPVYPDGSQILVVGHGGSMSGIILAACRLPIHAYRMLHFSNASLTILDIGDIPSIRCMNDTCHLAHITVTDVDADHAAG